MTPGLPRWLSGKESSCQFRRHSVASLGWEEPLERKWPPTPVFLLLKSHGQKNLVGYSLWGHKESDAIEHTGTHSQYSILYLLRAPTLF